MKVRGLGLGETEGDCVVDVYSSTRNEMTRGEEREKRAEGDEEAKVVESKW